MDNKENILQIAIQLFSSRGYDAVGIQEIVEQAGITKPTLYHYFGSKRGLLDIALEKYFGTLLPGIQKAAEYNRDLTNNLNSITKCLFNFAKENSSFYRMQLAMCFSSPESEPFNAVYLYNKKLNGILEKLFKLAASDHGNMRQREKRYAFTFLGIINNYITLYLIEDITLNDHTVYLAVHQFSHGIYS